MQKIITFLLCGMVLLISTKLQAQLKADFTIATDTVCSNITDSLVNTTSGGSLPYTYLWDYGNGKKSFAKNGYVSYSSSGTYHVKLSVTDAKGNKDSVTKSILVLGAPIADYSTFLTHCTFVIYNVNEDSLTPTSIAKYLILGESAPGFPPLFVEGQTYSYDYVKGGTYHYSIVVTGANGCKTFYTDSVRVPSPPILYFSPDTTVCLNSTITIDAMPKYGTPPFSILLGNKDTSSITTTIVKDTTFPIYIIDAKGCSLYDTLNIHSAPLPAADFSAIRRGCGPVSFLTNEDSLSPTKITQYLWVGQGAPGFGPLYLLGESGKYQYTKGGTYHYSLIITGVDGCIAIYEDSIRIANYVGISLPNNFSVCQNSTISISATPMSGTAPYHIWWNNKSDNITGPTIHSTITKDTAFAVQVLDSNHCYNYDSITIKVKPAPDAGWTVNYNGNNVHFHAIESNLSATSYHWFFGDGDSAASYEARHIYPGPKMYDASLIVTGSNGCTNRYDSIVNTGNLSFYIYPNPFHSSASIQYELAQKTNVQIFLYDINGKVIARLKDEIQLPGLHQVDINSNKPDLAPGTYFLKFVTDYANIMKPILKF